MTAQALLTPERWCAQRSRWQRLGLAMLCGALITAGHPPVGFPWIVFLALPALTWLMLGAPEGWAAAWTGWAAGFGYFVTSLHWVGNAFLVDPERFLLLLPLGVAGLPAGLAIFWGIAFWLARRVPVSGWRATLTLATVLAAVELARGYILTGFPWALAGYIWLDTPVMQTVSWAGPFGLTLFTLLFCAIPLVALARREYTAAVIALASVGALWIAGVMQRLRHWSLMQSNR